MPKRITKAPQKTKKPMSGFAILGVKGKTVDSREMHGDLKLAGPAIALMLFSEAFKEGLRLVQADIHVHGKKKGKK